MFDNTIDEATSLWLVLSPAAKELVNLTRNQALLEKRGLERVNRLSSVDKSLLLPYLQARAAKSFKNSMEIERREKLEALKRRKESWSIPQAYPNDPHNDMTREELLDKIVNILENRPRFEGNRPLAVRLGAWLQSLEDQVDRESLVLRGYK